MKIKKIYSYAFVSLLGIVFSFLSCKSTTAEPDSYTYYDTQIHVEGAANMRDLGGMVGHNNKRILYRKLFRSNSLANLTAADLDTLGKLNLTKIIDLRTDSEIEEEADKYPASVAWSHLPIMSEQGYGAIRNAAVLLIQGTTTVDAILMPMYTDIDSLKIANWTQIFNHLENGGATLWHCSAGKDRAGMTSALVLSALGVNRTTIISNYLESNIYLESTINAQVEAMNAAYGNNIGEMLRPLLTVKKEYIEAFFDAIETQYGSVDNFLQSTLNVDLSLMRETYLEK